MYPHRRLLLAALLFSITLGVLIAASGYIAALWLASLPPDDPPDNAPIRAAGVVIYVLAPAAAMFSLALSVPASYLQWNRRRPNFMIVALLCTVLSVCVTAYFTLPGSAISSAVTIAGVLSALSIIAAWAWWLALPRPNNALERAREA